jgi:Zn-dependent M28 family amino/carboxypeptidase/putative cell wall-binding protein
VDHHRALIARFATRNANYPWKRVPHPPLATSEMGPAAVREARGASVRRHPSSEERSMPDAHVASRPRSLAVVLTAALLLSLLPLWTSQAAADVTITPYPGQPGTIVERSGDGSVPSFRYRGENRFDTARLIALDTDTLQAEPTDTFATADTVVIARADFFSDALAGTYLAGLEEAPILLVSTAGAIAPATREALEEIDPDEVVLLGGVQAISQQVADDLAADYTVRRVSGPTRFHTAAAIAQQGADDLPAEGRTAIVASGEEFPDALVSGALSYAAGLPLLLVGAGVLPDVTAATLEDLEIEEVLLIGGTGRISDAVATEIAALDIEVERVFGRTRVGTAAELAALAVERYGFTTSHVNVARGDDFPDALAIGPHAGAERAPILLTNSPTGPDDGTGSNAAFLEAADCLRAIHVAGGVAAVTPEAEQALRTAATRAGEPCIALSPVDATNLVGEAHTVTAVVGDNVGTPVTEGSVVFTVEVDDDGDDDGPAEGTVELDEDGVAEFTFASATPGTVTITACVEGADLCATATKTFSTDALVDAISIDNLMGHLEALQACADAHGGDRMAGTPGYECSVDYVRDTLLAAGYPAEDIEETFFDFTLWDEEAPGVLTVGDDVWSTDEDEEIDYMSFSGAESGTPAVGPLLGVSNNVVPMPPDADPSTSSAGCLPEDFEDRDFTGAIALVQRGTCDFRIKAENAAAAGAVGVIIFNEGQPGRDGPIAGTLSADYAEREVPVFGATYAAGVALLEREGETATMASDTSFQDDTSSNLILRVPGSDPQGASMSGAHLDSVHDAPGINDNGSGSAGILEIALQMAELEVVPRNDTYFAWWGAEEFGLIGSQCYVEGGCGQDLEAGRVVDFTLPIPDYTPLGYALLEGGYLNYDMIASPNFIRGIYDGDGGAFGIAGPEGSAQIESTYQRFFESLDLPHQPTDFSGRSDYVGFTNYGIAAGGLFTGAEGIKTEEEEALYGGVAGESYDPCYHLPCDSLVGGWVPPDAPEGWDANIHPGVFVQNTQAAAHSALLFAMSLDHLAEGDAEGSSLTSLRKVEKSAATHRHDAR